MLSPRLTPQGDQLMQTIALWLNITKLLFVVGLMLASGLSIAGGIAIY